MREVLAKIGGAGLALIAIALPAVIVVMDVWLVAFPLPWLLAFTNERLMELKQELEQLHGFELLWTRFWLFLVWGLPMLLPLGISLLTGLGAARMLSLQPGNRDQFLTILGIAWAAGIGGFGLIVLGGLYP